MAEEVQINNVGGEGVASEVTLARLTSVMEAMAKKAGVDPKDVTKKLTALSTATTDTIKVSTKNRDSLKKNTKAVDESTSAFKKLASAGFGALGSVVGSLARSGTELTKAFLNGETAMTSFAQHLPVVGSQLSILTGLFDNSFAAFQSVATSGAAFNNSLTELRSSAANAYMSLDSFASFVGANSDKLAAFGGTATQGAKAISAMSKQLGMTGMQRDLLNMGFTFEEINESMLDYMYLTRAGNRVRMQNDAALAENTTNAAEYAKHQQVLAKLAGDEAKSAQAAIAQQLQDVAFQSQLARMGADEQLKVNNAMQLAMMTGGQDAVDALKAEFLGMPAVTEGARMYTATMSDQLGLLTSTLTDAQNENISLTQFNNQIVSSTADLMQMNANSAAEYDALIRASGAGVEGSASTIAGFFNNASLKYTDYFDSSTGQFSRAIAAEDAARALAEANNRDATTDSVATFMATVAKLQAAFQTQIVNPLMDAIGPALREISTAISGIEYDDEGNEIKKYDENGEIIKNENRFADAIATVSGYITDRLAPGILNFIDAFRTEDTMTVINRYFQSAVSGISNLIKDFFLGPLENTRPDGTGADKRTGGFLQDTLKPMFDAVGPIIWDGFTQAMGYIKDEAVDFFKESSGWVQAMIIGAGALFAIGNPLSLAMVAGARGLFSAASAGANLLRNRSSSTGATVGRDPRTGKFTSLNNAPDTGSSRLGRTAAGLGRGASRLLGPLAALLSVAEIGMIATDDSLSSDEKTVGVSEAAGGGGGALAGAAAGAIAGSFVPIIGTAIGGAIGGALGYFGGRYAGGAVGNAIVGEGDETVSTSPTASTLDQPGAQLAMIMSSEQVSAMERIAAINLSTFNTGLSDFLNMDKRELFRLSAVDITDFSTGLRAFAEIPDLRTNINAINSLDEAPVRSYTSAMENLVEVLENLNEVLAEDNKGMFGGGTGQSAADVLGQIGTATSGSNQSAQQLNSTMQQVLTVLNEMRDLDVDVERNTRNIVGSNLARGGVSTTAN